MRAAPTERLNCSALSTLLLPWAQVLSPRLGHAAVDVSLVRRLPDALGSRVCRCLVWNRAHLCGMDAGHRCWLRSALRSALPISSGPRARRTPLGQVSAVPRRDGREQSRNRETEIGLSGICPPRVTRDTSTHGSRHPSRACGATGGAGGGPSDPHGRSWNSLPHSCQMTFLSSGSSGVRPDAVSTKAPASPRSLT